MLRDVKYVNKFQQAEEENEIYLAPGTNYVLKEAWQQQLVDHFHNCGMGTYVVDNHYVDVDAFGIAHVEDATFWRKVNGYWTEVTEKGFQFDTNAMPQYY